MSLCWKVCFHDSGDGIEYGVHPPLPEKGDQPMKRANAWILGLKVAIGLLMIVMLIRLVDFRDILNALRNPMHPSTLFISFILLLPNLLLQWYRWHYLLKNLDRNVPFSESIRSLFGGMVVGFITPGRIGEMGRSLFIRNADPLRAVGLVFIDKFYSFSVILIVGVWGILYVLMSQITFSYFVFLPLAMIALIISATLTSLLLHPVWIRNFLYHFSLILPYREKLKRIIGCMDRFREGHARRFFLLSFLLYGVYILQFCLLAFAFQPVQWFTAVAATTSVILAKTLIPISLADLGIREGAAVYFFMILNIDKVTGFNSSILLFAINVLIPVIAGLFFIPRLGWKTGQFPKSSSSS